MSDTTPMIAWLERDRPEPSVIPADPVQRWLSLLIEDFADEWLWRPAMYWRWSNAPDRYLASTRFAEEVVRIPGVPLELRRRWVARRQTKLFVAGDGVDRANRAHAAGSFLNLLTMLEPIFSRRPFLLGGRPTIADVGLMGPFWRHFAHDPTTAQTMREQASAVFEWTARTWNARANRLAAEGLEPGIPDDWGPLLREIGETHLEALAQNAIAYTADRRSHDLSVQGVVYRDVPTSAYRPWCLRQLQEACGGAVRARGGGGPRGARAARLLGAPVAGDGLPLRARSRRHGAVLQGDEDGSRLSTCRLLLSRRRTPRRRSPSPPRSAPRSAPARPGRRPGDDRCPRTASRSRGGSGRRHRPPRTG